MGVDGRDGDGSGREGVCRQLGAGRVTAIHLRPG